MKSEDLKNLVTPALFVRYFVTNRGRREGFAVLAIHDAGCSGTYLKTFKTREEAVSWAERQR